MESQTVALHLPSAFDILSEVILHLANAFGETSNTVCPFSFFVSPNSKRRFALCIFHFAFFVCSNSKRSFTLCIFPN